VKGSLASPGECARSKLYWRVEDLRSTLDDCENIALGRPSQFPSRIVVESPH